MVRVSSDAIHDLAYDPETLELHVTFHHGGTYTHGGVPAELYERFLAAPSKGSFYNAELKHRYPR
jgi:hypothetical protein